MKAEVVDYAKQKWPLFFSRFFEVVRLSGKLNRSSNGFTIYSCTVLNVNEGGK